MSAKNSNLSDAHYGYDFVVATTQESINATMKEYLYNTQFPVVKMYWNQDANGNPVAVTYAELMQQTNGTDPLNVPSWKTGDPESQDIKNINGSQFWFAFEAAIGVPGGVSPGQIPDIISLQTGSQTVIFNLMCSEFKVVSAMFSRQGMTSFDNFSQPDNAPWLFTSSVRLQNIINNNNLPPAVKAQLDNFGPNAFSIQQLIFDLDNAALQSTPTITGIDPGTPTYNLLNQVFVGAYFNAMKQTAQPVLNYAVVKNVASNTPASSLTLTNMNLEASSYVNPATAAQVPGSQLSSLNYLCAVNGNTLPPAVPFTWNWVEQSEEASFDGVVSINRNTFATYFQNQLLPYVRANCYTPSVRVWLSGTFDATVNFQWGSTPGQNPQISRPSTGPKVLSFSFSSSASDQAGLNGDMGKSTLSTTFNVDVSFVNNTIIITQTLYYYIYVRSLASSESWKPVNKTITDTYTLAVDQSGGLTAVKSTAVSDNSEKMPEANWFINLFTGLNSLDATVDQWVRDFIGTSFQGIPVNVAQQFVFPGGKTFAFKDVVFSDYQDMISHITYAQTAS